MEVKFNGDGKSLVVSISGRLDTNTAPELENKLEGELKDSLDSVVFDFADLEYVSSAGLRVILAVSKKTNASGTSFVIKNVNDDVMEVFEITGFLDVLNIE